MRVASIGSMRPSINMLGLGLLLKPISVAMGKPKASPLSQPTHLRKHYPPSTCLGWASSQAQYPSRWANPRLHLLHNLPLHLGIILKGSFHHRMLPPWWLVQVPVWPEQVMMAMSSRWSGGFGRWNRGRRLRSRTQSRSGTRRCHGRGCERRRRWRFWWGLGRTSCGWWCWRLTRRCRFWRLGWRRRL